jgi:hypothetical protein
MRAPASRQAVAERAGRGAPGSNCKPVFARMCQGVAKQAVVAKQMMLAHITRRLAR